MIDAKSLTTVAAQDLKSALANEARAKESADKAAASVRAAKAERDELIHGAAAGGDVKAGDVLAAEEKTRRAETEAEIAGSIHAGAINLRHIAEVSKWHEDAGALQRHLEDATSARLKAATEVDRAFAALQQAIERHTVAGSEFRRAKVEALHFNGNHSSRAASNPVLAAAQPGTAPVVRNVSTADVDDLDAIVFKARTAPEWRKHIPNVAAHDSNRIGTRTMADAAA